MVIVVDGVPTVADAAPPNAFFAIAEARPFTEIDQAIWNVDEVTAPCRRNRFS